MFFTLFLVISSVSAIDETKKEYFSIQKKEMLIGPQLGLVSLIGGAGDWPSFIYYGQDIDNTTGLDVSFGFTESNNTIIYDYQLVDSMDICEVLDTALTEPEGPHAQLMIPELMGLYGTRCPIKQGTRNLNPYQFPTLSLLNDIGTGLKNFIVKIIDKNNDNLPLITLITPLDMKYWNSKKGSVADSSSSSTFLPPVLGFSMTLITLLVTK